jgi:hypothetical protein
MGYLFVHAAPHTQGGPWRGVTAPGLRNVGT